MKYFEYQISTADPSYGNLALWDDMEKMFIAFESNSDVASVDICGSGGDTAAILVGTQKLENGEVEALVRNSFKASGRGEDHFKLLALNER